MVAHQRALADISVGDGALAVLLLGVVERGETVHPPALAGTGLIVVGAWVTSRRERPPVPVATSHVS
jgi:hypothetical protein